MLNKKIYLLIIIMGGITSPTSIMGMESKKRKLDFSEESQDIKPSKPSLFVEKYPELNQKFLELQGLLPANNTNVLLQDFMGLFSLLQSNNINADNSTIQDLSNSLQRSINTLRDNH